MQFSREPVIWIAAAIAALQLVLGWLNGELTMTLVTAAATAIGGVMARNRVIPMAKIEDEL